MNISHGPRNRPLATFHATVFHNLSNIPIGAKPLSAKGGGNLIITVAVWKKAGSIINLNNQSSQSIKKGDIMKTGKLLAMVAVLSFFCVLFFGMDSPALGQEEYIYVSCMGNLEFFNAHKFGWK